MENQAMTIVEGLLFIVGDEGLTLPQCAAVLDVSESEARLVLEDLQRMYADDQRGIEVVDYGGVFKFVSKASIHPYAQKLFANAKDVYKRQEERRMQYEVHSTGRCFDLRLLRGSGQFVDSQDQGRRNP